MYKKASQSQQRRTSSGNFASLKEMSSRNDGGVDPTVFSVSAKENSPLRELEIQKRALMAEMNSLTAKSADLKNRVQRAQVTRANTGKYTNLNTYTQWQLDLRSVGQEISRVQGQLFIVNSEIKSIRKSEPERIFVDVAKEFLAGDVFHKLMEIAIMRMERGAE